MGLYAVVYNRCTCTCHLQTEFLQDFLSINLRVFFVIYLGGQSMWIGGWELGRMQKIFWRSILAASKMSPDILCDVWCSKKYSTCIFRGLRSHFLGTLFYRLMVQIEVQYMSLLCYRCFWARHLTVIHRGSLHLGVEMSNHLGNCCESGILAQCYNKKLHKPVMD